MAMINRPLLDISDAGYGDYKPEMIRYWAAVTERALAMDNRGSIRCGADGKLDPGFFGILFVPRLLHLSGRAGCGGVGGY